ncbi:DUF4380 domain-containing protein [Massilia sp. DD77]|uniref:DUF4380 domain-containing protein n=1 Tax=Massilia sp. DD77 TaxID=3109349 RepID=UPI00300059DE
MPRPGLAPLFSVLATCALAMAPANAQLRAHRIDNGTVTVLASEAAGGRLLSFALAGQPNFLLVDEEAGNPDTGFNAFSNNVPYLGHEVWVGPQKEWWTDQTVNPERAKARAPWPPDPYLSLAPYALVQRTPAELVVDSPPSLVTGIQLRKRYALVKGRPNSLQLDVRATNRRNQPVARDIWFNTRVRPDTRVYVPVASKEDVRMEAATPEETPVSTLADGILSLDPPDAGARKGKLFIQPAGGWMAAFHGKQAFVIQFRLQPRAAIHPDQGQVELYHEVQPGEAGKGVLEMEVHAPFVRLAPGKAMRASEHWTLLPYQGPATREAHLAFLRQHARQLGLTGW